MAYIPSISNARLQADAVTTDKIADDNVTTPDIADDAVTQDQLADNSVGTAQLQDDAVTQNELADDSVGAAQIITGAVTTTEIADGTIVHGDVNAANIDGADATPSLRTLGYTAGKAMPGESTLDEIANPAADLDMDGFKITDLGTPSLSTDAATTDLDLTGAETIDGVVLADDDRVLVAGQTDASENGIYVVDTGGAWTRATDFDSNADVTAGAYMVVTEGTTYADSVWLLVSDDPLVLDTDDLDFVELPTLGDLVAGGGLTKTGNTVDVGAGTGITVNANDVAIDTSVVPRKGVANTFTAKQTFTAIATAIATYSADRTVDLSTDHYLIMNSTGAQRTVTLPSAHTAGDEIYVKRTGANNVVVATNDSDTIDGSASDFTISGDLEAFKFVSDGSNWWVF